MQVGPFVVLQTLGRGAMGEVYLVRHVELEQRFALKVLARELLEDEAAVGRFVQELESLARVADHPGMVKIHSAGRTPDGRPYFAMEYVEGGTLKELLRTGLSSDQALELLEQLARILAYAHEQGLVHRDLKPENILITPSGWLRLSDFGVAKILRGRAGQGLTRTGEILGTPIYMAPEQVVPDGKVGPWTDVYALGALLYEAVSGSPPFRGATSVEIYGELMDGKPAAPLLSVKPDADPRIDALCARCLAMDPTQRFADAGQVAEAIASVRAQPAPSEREGLPGWLLGAAAAMCGLSLVLGGVAVVVDRGRRPQEVRVESLDDLRSLLNQRQFVDAARAGEALRGQVPAEALDPLLEQANAGALGVELEAGDLRAAHARLEGLRDARQVPGRPWVLALCGELGAALEAPEKLPPAARARVAAWDGQAERVTQALRQVEPRARAVALAWELSAWVEVEQPELPRTGESLWGDLARTQADWARGLPGLARLGFRRVRDAANTTGDRALELEACLGSLRAALASERHDEGIDAWVRALELVETPFERGRCMAWGAPLTLALVGDEASLLRLEAAAEGPAFARARELAPGLPVLVAAEAHVASSPALESKVGLPSPRLGEVGYGRAELWAQAQAAAHAGEPERARDLARRAGASEEVGSFALAEVELGRLGGLGPGGLALAQLDDLARAAEAGAARREAQQARDRSKGVKRLLPSSPAVWIACSRAALVLHQAEEAELDAAEAVRLAPGDPACLLAQARAKSGAVEPLRLWVAEAEDDDSEPHRALLKALEPVLEAFRSAREACPDDSSLTGRIDLETARLLLERGRCRARVESDRPLSAEFSEAQTLLDPLLAGVDVQGIAEQRERLAKGLSTGRVVSLNMAESMLSQAAAGVSPLQLEALLLRALSGGPKGPLHARAYLALAADLPARALLRARKAESPAATAPRELALSGFELDPRQAVVCFQYQLRRAMLGQIDADSVRDLASACRDSPEWIPLALRLLEPIERSALDRLRRDEHLPWALALAASARRLSLADVDERRWLAERAAAQASLALRKDPGPGVHMVRALALVAWDHEELAADIERDMACARAQASWSSTVLIESLRHAPDPDPLVDELLAHGFLRNHQALIGDGLGDNAASVNARLRPLRATLAGFDANAGVNPGGPLYLSGQLHDVTQPRLAAVLRINAVSEVGGDLEGRPMRELQEKLLNDGDPLTAHMALAEYRRHRKPNGSQETERAARALARAGIHAGPAGSWPQLRLDLLRAPGVHRQRPYTIQRLEEQATRHIPADTVLWEAWFRLRHPGWVSFLQAQSREVSGPLLSPGNLTRGRGHASAVLLGCLERDVQLWAAKRFLSSNDLDEMLLAGLRALAFGVNLADTQWWLYDFVYWKLRWSGLDPSNDLDLRRSYLRLGVILAQTLEEVSGGVELRAIRALRADLLLDLAGLAGKGSVLRESRISKASELLEQTYPNNIALWLERCEPNAWWRYVRLRVLTGSKAEVRDACKAFRTKVKQGDFRKQLKDWHRHYYRNDPLAPELDAFNVAKRARESVVKGGGEDDD